MAQLQKRKEQHRKQTINKEGARKSFNNGKTNKSSTPLRAKRSTPWTYTNR